MLQKYILGKPSKKKYGLFHTLVGWVGSKKSFSIKNKNKIGHSSRSSSIQRSKTTEEVSGNFEKFSFPSIEKRWTKDKQKDTQKEKK